MIKTERLNIMPFEMKYLSDYFRGFNSEITKYQWPNPFENIEDARSTLQAFLTEMNREETLILSILSKNNQFLGSIEIHGLSEDCPELGLWILTSEQNKGYASEALNSVLEYTHKKYNKSTFYYEADIRNTGSINLLNKLNKNYEIIEQGLEKITTDSGKYLELQGYILKVR